MTRKWATARSFPSLMPESDAMVMTAVEHFYMHEGLYFQANHRIETLEPNGVYYIGFITGASPIHMFPLTIQSNIALLEYVFYEDATFTGGAEFTPSNKNRIYEKAPTVSLYGQPTVTTPGTELVNIVLIGSEGVGNRRAGGSVSTEAPWLFKPNTKYLAKLTNKNSVAGKIQTVMSWYDEVSV